MNKRMEFLFRLIPGIRGEIFRSILKFVYTVKISEIDEGDIGREILVGADRFDCTQLKLFADSAIVDKFLVVADAAECLIFADSFSCALF
mmetsp:Transcript_15700/g.36146  ORF Transcript_15700/g.36146 Transcript_15700/m.36146 type:complete len:90 (-) Transcript_15700:3107-3376(-)